MSKNFRVIMIIIWGFIALVLTGLLIYFISGGQFSNSYFKWNWEDSFTPGKFTVLAQKSVPVTDINTISISSSSADVNFSHSKGTDIEVQIKGKGGSQTKDMYSVTTDGGKIVIKQNFNPVYNFPFIFGWNSQTINIILPDSYNKDLTLGVTSGDIKFDGNYTFGSANLTLVSGDIDGGTIKADSLSLNCTSGDVSLSGITADSYNIHGISGDDSVGSLSGAGNISDTSGDMRFGITALSGDSNISSTSGDITIGISKSVSANIDAKAQFGDVNTGLPLNHVGDNKHEVTGNVGSAPYNSLSVSVLSGDININQN